MLEQQSCKHPEATIAFQRSGTRLHPKVWMEEICLACRKVLDRKAFTRGLYETPTRREK